MKRTFEKFRVIITFYFNQVKFEGPSRGHPRDYKTSNFARVQFKPYIREGQFVKNYAGAATSTAFANFVRKELNPGPRRLVTMQEFASFTDNDDTQVVIMYNAMPMPISKTIFRWWGSSGRCRLRSCGRRTGWRWTDWAPRSPSARWRSPSWCGPSPSTRTGSSCSGQQLIVTRNKSLLNCEYNVTTIRPKFLASPHEDQVEVYQGPGHRANVSAWVMATYHGLMGLRTEHNQHQFTAPCVHIYLDTDFHLNPKTSHYWRNRLMEVASEFRDRVRFSLSRAADYQHELEHFGLVEAEDESIRDPDTPLVAAWDKFGQKFVMRDAVFSLDGFRVQLATNICKDFTITEKATSGTIC